MYVRPISTRLFSGMLMPEMRAMPYPCRCLCRGFEQMTSTAPWRRMILHFSHIGLTDGRTFMVLFQKAVMPLIGSGCRWSCRYHSRIERAHGPAGTRELATIAKGRGRTMFGQRGRLGIVKG